MDGIYSADEIVATSLRFRRPPGEGADPRVSPGGPDYFGAKTPGKVLDCETPAELFRRSQLDFPALLKCSKVPHTYVYRLRRDAEPSWELVVDSTTPECMAAVLARIPIPREIVYQARARDENSPFEPVDCFVSRLAIEKGKILDLRVPLMAKTRLDVTFPPSPAWNSMEAAQKQLTSWAIAPFVQGERVSGKLFPSGLCGVCIGKGNLTLEKDFATQPKWGFQIENSPRED